MLLARLIPVLLCVCLGTAAFSKEPAESPGAPIYRHVSGVLNKVGGSGKTITLEDAAGGKTRIDLPADVRVQKRISLSELAAGESIQVKFAVAGGRDEIGTAQIDRRLPALPGPVWDGRPLPERPGRYQGRVKSVEGAARRLAIERVDGEIRWFAVSERAMFIVVGPPSVLSEGDSAQVTFRGSAAGGQPVFIQAESSEAKGKR